MRWDFAYDGDGARTVTLVTPYEAGVPGTATLTTYYFGGAYEITGEDTRSYYSFGGQTILKDGTGELTYLISDHLGSTVAVTDDEGTLITQQRYLPFGGERELPNFTNTALTDFGYTGQRDLGEMGLMDYKARFYSPYLNQFTQPDTIVPDPSNPQDWNRYAYARNNPVKYTDPSGHDVDCGLGDSYCNESMHEYHTSWKPIHTNSNFKNFMKAKDSYNYYNNHPDVAIKDLLENSKGSFSSYDDVDAYTLADMYSQDVKHMMFNPVTDDFVMREIDRLNALKEGGGAVDPEYYYTLAFGLFIVMGPDGGGGGGGGGGYLDSWANTNFGSVEKAFNYHYNIHGGPWPSPEAYTGAAKKFYSANVNMAQPWILQDGSEGLKISTRKYYGIYTTDGKIVTFGEH